ncbi:MAG: transcription elongation factor GreA [Clostridia bacterium]|nr:transcription elongation factor GreA [Clostridia bacterium]
MQKENILTKDSYDKLKEELEQLKTVGRTEIIEKIKVARAFGDLSENAEYDEAKNDQAMIENRINEIEDILKSAKVIDEDEISTDRVGIGSKIKIKEIGQKGAEILSFTIMSSNEIDPKNGIISNESPIGRAVWGKKRGNKVEVELPDGNKKNFKIMEIYK